MSKRPRCQLSRSKVSPRGKHAWAFGFRFGYWPCLGGPFIHFSTASHRIDLWYGRESYWKSDGS